MGCAFCHNLIGTGDRAAFNPAAGPGVAVREFPLRSGFADYLLLVDRKVPGVVEAKREGTPLSGVTAMINWLPATR